MENVLLAVMDTESLPKSGFVFEMSVVLCTLGSKKIGTKRTYAIKDMIDQCIPDQKIQNCLLSCTHRMTLAEALRDVEHWVTRAHKGREVVFIAHALDRDLGFISKTYKALYGKEYTCFDFMPKFHKVCSQCLVMTQCPDFLKIHPGFGVDVTLERCLQRIGRPPGSQTHSSLQDCLDLIDVLDFLVSVYRIQIPGPTHLHKVDPRELSIHERKVACGLVESV
jgi:hypothetical protein